MKILVVNYEFPPLGGGGGVIASQIAEELAGQHAIHVLTTGRKGLPKFEIVNGIEIHRVPVLGRGDKATASLFSLLSFPLSSTLKGIRLFRKNKYDAIHTHFAIPSGITGVALSKLFGRPNVLSVHGGDIYDPSKSLSPHKNLFLRKTVEKVLNHSTVVMAQSKDVRARVITHYNVKKQIGIIPLGLKTPSFERASRSELGLSEDDFLIISIGRLVKRKGLEFLLQAVAKIGNPNVRVLLVGEGPERGQLESLALGLRISPQVCFTGTVSEERKFQLLSASDVFVLCSLHEGFGIVYLEAMHCGLPVVAADEGGQTDFLEDGKNGFLVPSGDSETLSTKLLSLLQSKELRENIGVNNMECVKHFSIDATAEKYEEVLEQMVKEKGDKSR